jgi:DNA processing protein
MNPKDLKFWVALHSVEGIGAATYAKLLQKFGSPEDVFSAAIEDIASIPRLSLEKAKEILAAVEKLDQVEKMTLQLYDNGADIITLEDETYPAVLRAIKNPPPILYCISRMTEADQKSIAIVGSRDASDSGLRIARGFGSRLVERGYTIISGYAKGIDTEGHLGALEAGGRTIMVLSMGLMHFKLRDAGFESIEYLKKQGGIISEFYPTTSWTVGAAMARNRIVVGLSQAVLIVECKIKSGTMNTARVAKEMDKPLFVLKYSEAGEHVLGNEELLESGAIPISRFADVEIIEKTLEKMT